MAAELVNGAADVIVAVTTDGALALKGLTSAIPIVFVLVPDPVAMGLVGSLPRPGGNLTGLSLLSNDVSGKRLALLKEAVPHLSTVALLYNPTEVSASRVIKANEAASRPLGLSLSPVGIPNAEAIEPAFEQMERDRVDGAVIIGSMMFNERARVGAAALAHRLPSTCIVAEMVPYGLLMSYGQDFPDYFRKAADYAARILRGASPADLPVEQPTLLKHVINLKVAKAIGLSLPSSLLVSADEVIE
jgi:putative tryptophan/tyrosine transport system substrate-binding protein